MRMAAKSEKKSPTSPLKPTRVLRGKRLYAELRSSAATLRITFASAEERERVEGLVQKLLAEQSKLDGN